MNNVDHYKTINAPSEEVLYKERNSKFYAYAFPVSNESEIKRILSDLKKKHYGARHWCYAYRLGIDSTVYRANDDGEPNNSAGQPIYGQIQSFELTNILVVVVRYFGGTKLGISGLINAYKSAARLSLEHSNIITKTIDILYEVRFDYKNMNTVMRIVKEHHIKIVNQEMELKCMIKISVPRNNSKRIYDLMANRPEINIRKIDV